MKKVNILGVGISKTTQKEAIETVGEWLSYDSGQARMTRFIVTPNPEMLVLAQKDKEFRDILNHADMAVPDGTGLVWLEKFPERVSGTDLMLSLCELAVQKDYSVGLLGGREGVAKKTKEELLKKFPKIRIKFAVSEIPILSLRGASPSTTLGINSTSDEAISNKEKRLPRPFGARNDKINVDLLFVAYGAPKQEKWIWEQIAVKTPRRWAKHSSEVERTENLKFKVAMGVGGAFDLISGKIKRAPKILQNLGLEWLWRLLIEPQRIKRIWNAVVVFPWLVFKIHLKKAI